MRTSLPLTCLLALLAATSASALPPTFLSRAELPLGSVITTGDYNGDGIPDLIAAVLSPTGDFEINIQISTGTGTFSQGPTFDLGPGFTPVAIGTADFNGDGKMDIAIVGTASAGNLGSVYVAIQRSSGFLITPIQLPEDVYNTVNIAIGDLNGDKKPDIAIPTASGIVFLINAGGGKFNTPELADITPTNFIVMADVNGDHHLDLIATPSICCYSQNVNVILGDGHGGFYEPASQPDLPSTKVSVADLNGDGKLDIVGTNGNILQFVLGNGDGTFGAAQTVNLPSPFLEPEAVVAADLNGDGIPDLSVIASSDYVGVGLLIFLNEGKAAFGSITPYSIAYEAANLLVADFTSSAQPDILVIPNGSSFDALLFSNGTGAFKDGLTFAVPEAPVFLVAGDFNNDGRTDLAGVNSSGLTVYLNAGNTSVLTAEAPLPFYSGPLVTGDFNGDGRLDLVAVSGSSASVLLGAGGGTFVLKPSPVSLSDDVDAIAATDINGDGKLDLVTNSAAVALGNGDGTFQAPLVDNDGYCYSYSPGAAAALVADFNRDGKPDLLTLCEGQINVFLNGGAQPFSYPAFSAYPNATGVAVGDFNHDGIPDFAYSVTFYSPNTTSSEVYVEFGTGTGYFNLGPPIVIPGIVIQLLAADVNGDGHVDLVALDTNDATLVVLAGKGDGTFQNPLAFGTASNPSCLLAATIHDPSRAEYPDLITCTSPGISIDYNKTK